MRFATRDGTVSYEEGLATAFQLFRDGRIQEAAMMFLVYADPEAIGVVGESEYTALADHLKTIVAHAALYEAIRDEIAQPCLTDNDEPAYKASPWAL